MYSNAKNFAAVGSSAEDAARMTTVPHTFHQDRELWLEASRRVIHNKCQASCEIEGEYWGKDFYYKQEDKGRCYETCYNDKFVAHFGETAVTEQGLRISFDRMKLEFQKYESINPYHEWHKNRGEQMEEGKFEDMASTLIEQTRKSRPNFHL